MKVWVWVNSFETNERQFTVFAKESTAIDHMEKWVRETYPNLIEERHHDMSGRRLMEDLFGSHDMDIMEADAVGF